jgi:hypothetical protein
MIQWDAQKIKGRFFESVFLANRVIVLSPRPGTVGATIPKTLLRTRQLTLLETAEYGALAGMVRAEN